MDMVITLANFTSVGVYSSRSFPARIIASHVMAPISKQTIGQNSSPEIWIAVDASNVRGSADGSIWNILFISVIAFMRP